MRVSKLIVGGRIGDRSPAFSLWCSMRMFLVALLLLVGCADETPVYQRQEGKTAEDLERDKADCEMRVLSWNVNMMDRGSFERACMRSKGWVQVNPPSWW